MKELEIGTPVTYTDDDGKSHQGVIHGVRRVDDVDGKPRVLTYLVDTGKDFHVEERHHDKRGEAITKRVVKLAEKRPKIKTSNEEFAKAVAEIDEADDDLPKAGITVEKVRQPEQIDVRPERVKPR